MISEQNFRSIVPLVHPQCSFCLWSTSAGFSRRQSRTPKGALCVGAVEMNSPILLECSQVERFDYCFHSVVRILVRRYRLVDIALHCIGFAKSERYGHLLGRGDGYHRVGTWAAVSRIADAWAP